MTATDPDELPYDLAERDFGMAITSAMLEDDSPAYFTVPAPFAEEAVALVLSAGLHPAPAVRLATVVEESILGDLCLLNPKLCAGIALLLGSVAETALPSASRAEYLAGIFNAKYDVES